MTHDSARQLLEILDQSDLAKLITELRQAIRNGAAQDEIDQLNSAIELEAARILRRVTSVSELIIDPLDPAH